MPRKFYIVERKDTPEQQTLADELHRLTNAYRYTNSVASEFDALCELAKLGNDVAKTIVQMRRVRGANGDRKNQKQSGTIFTLEP